MIPKKPARDRETDRLDTLLAKWGLHVGAKFRPARRALALKIQQNTTWGTIDDRVLGALFKAAKARAIRGAEAWVAGVLEDDVERNAFVGRLAGELASDRGPNQAWDGDATSDLDHARAAGVTLEEWRRQEDGKKMLAFATSERWPVEKVAATFGATVPDARARISAAMVARDGVTLDEWEIRQEERRVEGRRRFRAATASRLKLVKAPEPVEELTPEPAPEPVEELTPEEIAEVEAIRAEANGELESFFDCGETS